MSNTRFYFVGYVCQNPGVMIIDNLIFGATTPVCMKLCRRTVRDVNNLDSINGITILSFQEISKEQFHILYPKAKDEDIPMILQDENAIIPLKCDVVKKTQKSKKTRTEKPAKKTNKITQKDYDSWFGKNGPVVAELRKLLIARGIPEIKANTTKKNMDEIVKKYVVV